MVRLLIGPNRWPIGGPNAIDASKSAQIVMAKEIHCLRLRPDTDADADTETETETDTDTDTDTWRLAFGFDRGSSLDGFPRITTDIPVLRLAQSHFTNTPACYCYLFTIYSLLLFIIYYLYSTFGRT